MAEAPSERGSPVLIQPASISGEVERITPVERDDSVVALDMSQSSSSSGGNNRPAASPAGDADTCSICLDVLRELAVCDPCFHSFCYPCINAWSRINNICPLCKSTFDKIHHDIKSNHDYKIQNVPPVNRLMTDDIPPVLSLRQTPGDIHVPFMNPSWLFSRRRSTQHPLFTHQETAGPSSSHFFTSSFGDPHSGSVRITTHTPNISISLGGFSSNRPTRMEPANMVVPMNSASSSDSPLVGRSSTISQSIYDAINSVGAGSSAAVEQSESQSSNIPDMLRGIPATDRRRLTLQGRRLIYHHGFRVRHYSSNHTRDISLSWMQQRPASITRIMQWANRELSVLVDKRELSSTLGSLMRLLRTVEIGSRPFYTGLVGKLGSRTGHFIHELRSFALSPFAMDEYDRHAMYGPNTDQEKVATEITNEDIEQWSLDEIQEVKPISSSTSSPDGAALSRIPSRRSAGGDFAPATSSATCARLQSLTPVPLVVLSDDDDLTGNVTLTWGRANTADQEMVASTSSGRSRSRNGSRSVAIKSVRTVQRPMKLQTTSRSVLSARVISSDEDEFIDNSVDNDVESDFARRIKSVAIDVEEECNNSGRVSRDRSPVRSGKQRMKRRGLGSFASSSATFAGSNILSQTRRNEPAHNTATDNTLVKIEDQNSETPPSESPPLGGGNILTLGSSSVHQVASQSEMAVDPLGDSIQIITNATDAEANSNVTDDAPRIYQDPVPVEVKEDLMEDLSGLISIVKAEGRQTSQPPIKSEDSNIATVSSTESKTEFIPNPEIRPPGTCHSGMKLEFKQSTNEQDSMRVLDSSIREVTGLEPAPSSSSARSLTILPDDQIASGSQTAADDILTLTDDLRPKAIVPDLSESAAAEVNVVATTDHPIEVSESEEDAIVFLRQNIFTPPLVDLESGSENDAPLEADSHELRVTAQASTSDIIGQPLTYSLQPPTRSPVFTAAGSNVAIDDDSDENNELSRPTAPKLVKYYSSSSSEEDERPKRAQALLNRRLRQKRRRRDAFQLRTTNNKRNAVSSSQPSPEDLSPTKKFRPSQSDGSLDEPDLERPCQPHTSEPAPAEFGRFFSFGEQNFTTSNENSIENPIDLSMEQSRLMAGPSNDPRNHPLSGILSYSNVNGYSSDSEGLQDETFSPRARYHPYI